MPTFTEEYTTVEKAEWGRGQWDDEPDKAVWVDEATGLDCMVNRGPGGHWCGYVGVPEGHAIFGAGYDDVRVPQADEADEWSDWPNVHGGLTFASECRGSDEGPAYGICHIEQPGRPEKVWWFGFDCAHLGDLSPAYSSLRVGSCFDGDSYKPMGYVTAETARLAAQLVSATVKVDTPSS